jgi:hypothetical protein
VRSVVFALAFAKVVSRANGMHALTFNGSPAVPEHFNFPEEELQILKFWDEIKAFETSLKLAEGRPEYSFYDGPPFATGLPHYGHLLAGTIKVCLPCRCVSARGKHGGGTALARNTGYRDALLGSARILC